MDNKMWRFLVKAQMRVLDYLGNMNTNPKYLVLRMVSLILFQNIPIMLFNKF